MADLVKQATVEPTRKTTAAIAGGGVAIAVVAILNWLLATYAHVEVPAEVQNATVLIITVASSYFTHERAA